MNKEELGKAIRRNRERLGMSQGELAKKLNTTRQCISSWEIGRTEPDIGTLDRISIVLEINPSSLYQASANNPVNVIENNMRNLDNKSLDRIIAYATYLKTLQNGGD